MSTVASSIPGSLPPFLSTLTQLVIDGSWIPATSGKTFKVFNPSTANIIAYVAEGKAADIDATVKAAR